LRDHDEAAGLPGGAAVRGPDYYTSRSGHEVHRPEGYTEEATGATERCRDGSWSFSEHRSGTRSHHGGVARWLYLPFRHVVICSPARSPTA
jgi:hypothetical protein